MLHEIIPHHHHNHSDESYCSLDFHSSSCSENHAAENSVGFNETSCCTSDLHGANHSGICNLNIEASKQASVNFVAVFSSSSTFKLAPLKLKFFYKFLHINLKTIFYDSFSLRGPPSI